MRALSVPYGQLIFSKRSAPLSDITESPKAEDMGDESIEVYCFFTSLNAYVFINTPVGYPGLLPGGRLAKPVGWFSQVYQYHPMKPKDWSPQCESVTHVAQDG